MLALGKAHVFPRVLVRYCDAVPRENALNGAHRREAASVDRGPRPVQDHRPNQSHNYNPISRIVCSARPNDSVIPAPPSAVTTRTPSVGENET